MSDSNGTSGGIGFLGLLTIVFVIFKLTGHLQWSWWWVFSPIWIGWSIILAILLIIGAIWLISEVKK